jgi:hypothetical protein
VGGKVAQIMCTHVSKFKNDKRKAQDMLDIFLEKKLIVLSACHEEEFVI